MNDLLCPSSVQFQDVAVRVVVPLVKSRQNSVDWGIWLLESFMLDFQSFADNQSHQIFGLLVSKELRALFVKCKLAKN